VEKTGGFKNRAREEMLNGEMIVITILAWDRALKRGTHE